MHLCLECKKLQIPLPAACQLFNGMSSHSNSTAALRCTAAFCILQLRQPVVATRACWLVPCLLDLEAAKLSAVVRLHHHQCCDGMKGLSSLLVISADCNATVRGQAGFEQTYRAPPYV